MVAQYRQLIEKEVEADTRKLSSFDAFKQATAELDPVRSTELANQIDRKLWEGLPVIPLYQRPTFLAWRGTLRNVVENPTNEGPLWNAETWGFAAEASP